jgi:hypothetical protein
MQNRDVLSRMSSILLFHAAYNSTVLGQWSLSIVALVVLFPFLIHPRRLLPGGKIEKTPATSVPGTVPQNESPSQRDSMLIKKIEPLIGRHNHPNATRLIRVRNVDRTPQTTKASKTTRLYSLGKRLW